MTYTGFHARHSHYGPDGEMRPAKGAKAIETERRLSLRIARNFMALGCLDPWSDMDGRDWYSRATAEIRVEFGEDAGAFADVVAATSPQCDVSMNVKLAREEWTRRKSGQPMIAWIPCHAANLQALREGKELRGPKVRAFARALRGDTSAVVVDTWMLRASGVSERRRHSSGVLRATTEAIRLVSQWTNIPAAECQAIIWCHYRKANSNKTATAVYLPLVNA